MDYLIGEKDRNTMLGYHPHFIQGVVLKRKKKWLAQQPELSLIQNQYSTVSFPYFRPGLLLLDHALKNLEMHNT